MIALAKDATRDLPSYLHVSTGKISANQLCRNCNDCRRSRRSATGTPSCC